MKVNKYQRGQIWWFENSYSFDGSVQGKTRPAIIISNNKANQYSTNLIIIPCTTQIKRMDMKTHIKFNIDDKESIALCENLMSANIQKLTDYIGTCDNELLEKLENGIKVALGLDNFIDIKPVTDKVAIKDLINYTENVNNEDSIKSVDLTLVGTPKKLGRKPKYTYEDMVRFISDYDNHNIDYMIKKYNEVSDKAVQNKVYRFRKVINKGG